jgi:hypothetical protein
VPAKDGTNLSGRIPACDPAELAPAGWRSAGTSASIGSATRSSVSSVISRSIAPSPHATTGSPDRSSPCASWPPSGPYCIMPFVKHPLVLVILTILAKSARDWVTRSAPAIRCDRHLEPQPVEPKGLRKRPKSTNSKIGMSTTHQLQNVQNIPKLFAVFHCTGRVNAPCKSLR